MRTAARQQATGTVAPAAPRSGAARPRPGGPGAATALLTPVAACGTACSGLGSRRGDPAELRARALQAADHGDWETAASCWDDCLSSSGGTSVEAHRGSARAYLELGRGERAQEVLDAAAELYPDDAELLLLRGRLYCMRGFRRAAEREFQRVTELQPERADGWLALGRVQLELDLPVRAAYALQHHVDLGGTEPESLVLLARAQRDSGDLPAAVEGYVRLAADPTCSVDHLVEAVRAILDPRFDDERDAYTERALDWVDRAVAREPQNVEAHVARGALLEHLGRLDGAVASYRRAVELDAFHVTALTSLALVYERLGDLDGACEMVDRALELRLTDECRRTLEEMRSRWQAEAPTAGPTPARPLESSSPGAR